MTPSKRLQLGNRLFEKIVTDPSKTAASLSPTDHPDQQIKVDGDVAFVRQFKDRNSWTWYARVYFWNSKTTHWFKEVLS